MCGIEPGGRLGLFGFGASARCAIQIAVHWGCSVFVCTRSEPERERALELGAVWAGGYDESPPEPLDAAITFAPSGDVVVAALRALDRGGTVAINAIHLDRMPEFPYDLLWWERRICSVANVTRRDAREFLAARRVDPGSRRRGGAPPRRRESRAAARRRRNAWSELQCSCPDALRRDVLPATAQHVARSGRDDERDEGDDQ